MTTERPYRPRLALLRGGQPADQQELIEGQKVSYRDYAPPPFDNRPHTTSDWLTWMEQQGDVLLPVAPPHDHSCAVCKGASRYIDDGPETWTRCLNCRGYGHAVDVFVPITYSIDAGLESMLHRYKDFDGYAWMRSPLGALLNDFVRHHGACLDHQTPRGRLDVATTVPPGGSRGSDHLHGLLSGVVAGDHVLNRWSWDFDLVRRAPSVLLPGRGELNPDAYTVEPRGVEGMSVLVLDDTWTSGRSAAGVALALKEAGATHVAVLTLGRQLNLRNAYGSTMEIYGDAARRRWSLNDCILCT
jgi:hypothetical protein